MTPSPSKTPPVRSPQHGGQGTAPAPPADTDVWRIPHRLYQFYCDATDAHIPEATRLAKTIETWWPAILVALLEDVTNARTEGFNRSSRTPSGCMRIPETRELPEAGTLDHCAHPSTTRRGMTEGHRPAESRRAGLA